MIAGVSVRLSVRLFVSCLNLTRERKGLGSRKLAGWKPITRVTRESEDQRSRSHGRSVKALAASTRYVCVYMRREDIGKATFNIHAFMLQRVCSFTFPPLDRSLALQFS